MADAFQLPTQTGAAQRVGKRLYRKRLLPVGPVMYNGEQVYHAGRPVEFSKDDLEKVAQNFATGTRDQVSFVLANEANEHNDDPERWRGEVKALEPADDGLDAIVELSDRGAQLVEENPKLGVSARIFPGGDKGPELGHVLGTLDPKSQQMGPWQSIQLSQPAQGDRIIDLTGGTVDKPSGTDAGQGQQAAASGTRDGQGSAASGLQDQPPTDAEVQAAVDTLARAGAADAGTAGRQEPAAAAEPAKNGQPDPAVAQLSQQAAAATKRANDAASAAEDAIALANWQAERKTLELAGVPKVDLDEAEPVILAAAKMGPLELSGGQKIDAASAMRKLLEQRKGTVDLSAERGTGVVTVTDEDEATKAVVDQLGKEYGE